jgi:GntR family transcriptional regulator / MocR family aminotransferase
MTISRADLPVVVDRSSRVPMAAQIAAQVRETVTAGVLCAGERLPSTRDLAAALAVSRTVVTTAYAQLYAEGWLEGRHGSGSYVADVAPVSDPANEPNRAIERAITSSTTQSSSSLGLVGAGVSLGLVGAGESLGLVGATGAGELVDLRPGIPWSAGIEPAMWRRAWRYAGTHPPSPWPDMFGLPELRAGLVSYLRRSRGLNVTPAHVLVTRGVSGGLALLAAATIRPGDKVGVEEPGYPSARKVLRQAGAQIVPCRVDAHGIVPGELPGGLRLLYTTPAHQYPLGGRLPVGRRQAIIAWARATGAIVAEDDYDSEFRYDVGPLPALYSMDPEVIVYLGTASKTLTAGFGAGWLVASPDLVRRLAGTRRDLADRVPEPVQHALLAMLTSGDLERHIRRMRLEYARRRAALVEALTGPAGQETFRLLGDTAGLHVVLELRGYPAERIVAEAATRGVELFTLDRYFAGSPAMNGLILGYGTASLPKVRRAARVLCDLLAQ